jgi:hypothetical protein
VKAHSDGLGEHTNEKRAPVAKTGAREYSGVNERLLGRLAAAGEEAQTDETGTE